MEWIDDVFKSYNTALENAHELFFQSVAAGQGGLKGRELDRGLREFIDSSMRKWEDAAPDQGGYSPRRLFESISGVEEAMEVFKRGAVLCDDRLPRAFIERLSQLGSEAVLELMKLSGDAALMESSDETEFLISVTAIKVLGEIKAEGAADYLVRLCFRPSREKELFLESIREALIDIGEPALRSLAEAVSSPEEFTEAHEHLLLALSAVGSGFKSDGIYGCIKNAFYKMDNKAVGASCLADYGDGRAIPALRGYAEKNLATVDNITLYELKLAVERLGGSMEDILQDRA